MFDLYDVVFFSVFFLLTFVAVHIAESLKIKGLSKAKRQTGIFIVGLTVLDIAVATFYYLSMINGGVS